MVRSGLIFRVSRVRRPDQLRLALNRMQSWDPLAHRFGVGAQALAMIAAGAAGAAAIH